MANNEFTVRKSETFSVSVEELYSAWNEPEKLKKWWKPLGNELTDVTNDIRKGGTVSYRFNNNGLSISGEYIEVNENQKLVYTWNWEMKDQPVSNAPYMLTVEFKSAENGSEIQILQENFESEEALRPHEEGWEKGLKDLKQFLEGETGSDPSSEQTGTQVQQQGTSGYGETEEQQKVAGG